MKRRKRTHVDDLDKESGAVQRRAIVARVRLWKERGVQHLCLSRQSLKERTGEGENAIAIFWGTARILVVGWKRDMGREGDERVKTPWERERPAAVMSTITMIPSVPLVTWRKRTWIFMTNWIRLYDLFSHLFTMSFWSLYSPSQPFSNWFVSGFWVSHFWVWLREIKKKRKLFKDYPFIFSKPLFPQNCCGVAIFLFDVMVVQESWPGSLSLSLLFLAFKGV